MNQSNYFPKVAPPDVLTYEFSNYCSGHMNMAGPIQNTAEALGLLRRSELIRDPTWGAGNEQRLFSRSRGYHTKSSKLFIGSARLCRQVQGKSLALPGFFLPPRSLLKAAQGYRDRHPNFPLLDTSEVRRKKKESSLEGFSSLASYPN